jgi:beta-phosphoglucomutase family hydrolase
MKERRGVLWDLDGVIVDTRDLHYTTWEEVLKEHQIEFSRDHFDSISGMNNADTLTTLTGSPPSTVMVDEIAGRKEELFRRQLAGKLNLMPGVGQWLDQFREWVWPQAVASSAPMLNIEAIIAELGIREYFDTLVSGMEMPGKPAPDVFLEAAKRIGMSPGKCIVIEDAVVGVEAAKLAGMYCIAVTTYTSRDTLTRADRVVEDLSQLPKDTQFP